MAAKKGVRSFHNNMTAGSSSDEPVEMAIRLSQCSAGKNNRIVSVMVIAILLPFFCIVIVKLKNS